MDDRRDDTLLTNVRRSSFERAQMGDQDGAQHGYPWPHHQGEDSREEQAGLKKDHTTEQHSGWTNKCSIKSRTWDSRHAKWHEGQQVYEEKQKQRDKKLGQHQGAQTNSAENGAKQMNMAAKEQ